MKPVTDFMAAHSQKIFFIFIIFFQLGLILVIGLDRPYWGDEEHFVATIRYFGEFFHPSSIADYEEVQGPLVFVVYALGGKLIGFGLPQLRLLSLLFSTVTFIVVFYWYASMLSNKGTALLAFLLFWLNPYLWGLGFFVFPDMLSLAFLILIAWAVQRENIPLLFAATAAALLSRQYFVFMVAAVGLYYLVSLYRGRKYRVLHLVILFVACLPLGGLLLLWGGAAPPTGFETWVIDDGQIYRGSFITIYIVFMTVYLIPVLLLVGPRFLRNIRLWAGCLPLTVWFFFFPVRPSYTAAVQTDYETLGLVHRIIQKVLGDSLLEKGFLWMMFWCGLVLLAHLLSYEIKRYQLGKWDYGHFLTLVIVCFLLIMPLSYQVWEKYLISFLPFVIARLMLLREEELGKEDAFQCMNPEGVRQTNDSEFMLQHEIFQPEG